MICREKTITPIQPPPQKATQLCVFCLSCDSASSVLALDLVHRPQQLTQQTTPSNKHTNITTRQQSLRAHRKANSTARDQTHGCFRQSLHVRLATTSSLSSLYGMVMAHPSMPERAIAPIARTCMSRPFGAAVLHRVRISEPHGSRPRAHLLLRIVPSSRAYQRCAAHSPATRKSAIIIVNSHYLSSSSTVTIIVMDTRSHSTFVSPRPSS